MNLPALFTTTLAVMLSFGIAAQSPGRVPKDDLPLDFGAKIPYGLTEPIEGFVDHAPSDADLALGRKLFFDPILSSDRTVACASCHDPAHGFADPALRSNGIVGRTAIRHTPSLFNRGFGRSFAWDGKNATLAEQVLAPIANPDEMALPLADAVARLVQDAHYAAEFAPIPLAEREPRLSRALSAFVSRIFSGNSAVDRFQAGDFTALGDQERTGLWIYESKGGCWRCHSGPNFSDERYHDTGVGAKDAIPEEGRFAVTHDAADRGKFKTPTLRGLAQTAPYMHDGSIATLEDVVAFYRKGANPNANLDERLKPLELTDADAVALVAFLRALSRPSTASGGELHATPKDSSAR